MNSDRNVTNTHANIYDTHGASDTESVRLLLATNHSFTRNRSVAMKMKFTYVVCDFIYSRLDKIQMGLVHVHDFQVIASGHKSRERVDIDACLSEATILRAFAVVIACALLRDGEFQTIPVACWRDFNSLRNAAVFRIGIG